MALKIGHLGLVDGGDTCWKSPQSESERDINPRNRPLRCNMIALDDYLRRKSRASIPCSRSDTTLSRHGKLPSPSMPPRKPLLHCSADTIQLLASNASRVVQSGVPESKQLMNGKDYHAIPTSSFAGEAYTYYASLTRFPLRLHLLRTKVLPSSLSRFPGVIAAANRQLDTFSVAVMALFSRQ